MIFRNIGSNTLIIKIKKEGTPSLKTFFSKAYGSDVFEDFGPEDEIMVHAYKYVEIKSNSNTLNSSEDDYYHFSLENSEVRVLGNIADLINGSNTLQPYAFYGLFKDCNKLIDASQLELPFMLLAQNCYNKMFSNCSNLIRVPALPATTLAEGCYKDMFEDCISLRTAPQLPATELTLECYGAMFRNCTSLTTPPSLPATELADSCYSSMFDRCSSLTSIPDLSATTLADNCYANMFEWCLSITSISSVLPATILTENCYANMFANCKRLVSVPSDLLSVEKLTKNCYNGMFRGCENLSTAPILSSTTLAQGCYFGMFQHCKKLKKLPVLPATTLANYCYTYMFQECNSIIDLSLYELPATTLTSHCYAFMFANCENLTTSPLLPATNLASACYAYMFEGCKNLSSLYIDTCICDVEHGTTSTTEEYHSDVYIKDWLKGTASYGIFYGLKDCYENIYSEIPSGWDFRDITPLTIIAGENTKNLNIKVKNTKELKPTTILYRIEGEAKWNTIPTTGIVLETSGVIDFRNMSKTFSKNNASFYRFNITGVGDISLSGALKGLNSFDKENIKAFLFTRLFEGNDNIVSVSGLDFLFKKLLKNCYARMFADCINLEDIPVLKAERLALKCYKEMFQGCISITGAIIMNEKILKPYCYLKMFEGCEWIPSADLSKAQEISLGCYRDMFYKCTNLTDIVVNFTNWKTFKDTDLWLTNTAYFGTFIKPLNLSLKDDSKIPLSWKPFVTIKEDYDYLELELNDLPDFTKHKTLVKHEDELDDGNGEGEGDPEGGEGSGEGGSSNPNDDPAPDPDTEP